MKKFYDIEIDSQIELENGKTLGKLEESKISVNDGNCSSGSAGGVMVVTLEPDDDGVLHANKTFAEIKSAIKSGLDVNCVINQRSIARLSGYYFDE